MTPATPSTTPCATSSTVLPPVTADDGAADFGKTLSRVACGMAERAAEAFHGVDGSLGRIGRLADRTDKHGDVVTDLAADRLAEGLRTLLRKIFGGAERRMRDVCQPQGRRAQRR